MTVSEIVGYAYTYVKFTFKYTELGVTLKKHVARETCRKRNISWESSTLLMEEELSFNVHVLGALCSGDIWARGGRRRLKMSATTVTHVAKVTFGTKAHESSDERRKVIKRYSLSQSLTRIKTKDVKVGKRTLFLTKDHENQDERRES